MNCCGNRHPIPLGEEHIAADILLHGRPEIIDYPPLKYCNYCGAEHYYFRHAFRLEPIEPTFTTEYGVPRTASAINVSTSEIFSSVDLQPQSVSRASLEQLRGLFSPVDIGVVDELNRRVYYAPMEYQAFLKKTTEPESDDVSPWNP